MKNIEATTPAADLMDRLAAEQNAFAGLGTDTAKTAVASGQAASGVQANGFGPSVTTVLDDEGSQTGLLHSGDSTDDTTPTFLGRGIGAGYAVEIYDNGVLIATVQTDASGNWQWTPSPELAPGQHAFTFSSMGYSSDPFVLDIEGEVPVPTPEPAPHIGSAIDDTNGMNILQNGDSTDDTTPRLLGSATAGATVYIYDNGVLIGQTVAGADGKWQFTPTLESGHHSLTATVNGQTSEPFDLDVNVGAAPEPTPEIAPHIGSAMDDANGTSLLHSGDSTEDSTPRFLGTATPGADVFFYDNGVLIGKATANDQGMWQFSPTLQPGQHSITASANGQDSEPFDLVVENGIESDALLDSAPALFDTALDDAEPDAEQWANLHASLEAPADIALADAAPADSTTLNLQALIAMDDVIAA